MHLMLSSPAAKGSKGEALAWAAANGCEVHNDLVFARARETRRRGRR
jgi:hypothetical protein